MTSRSLTKRVKRLESRLAPARKHCVVVRFEGGGERILQPTAEELATASDVITVLFVAAKDGRPATPEEIAQGDTSDGEIIVDHRR